jgi:nickel/cobalt transporter (NicO) family protein
MPLLAATRLFDDRALEGVMLRLLDGTVGSLPLQLLAVLTATGIGAVHALGPGHGKVLVGAYLASSRGRARDAVALGGLVAAMHTATVLVLGIGFASLQRVPGGDRLDAGLRLVSGLAISAVGVWLVHRHLSARAPRGLPVHASTGHPPAVHRHDGTRGHAEDGAPDHLAHDHTHGHHHELPAEIRPLSRTGIVALATSGGLLPSPAAFVVLASAIAIGRPGFGLVLVLAFSVGLALTLTGVGVSIVWGRGHLERLGGRLPRLRRGARRLPLIAALVVLAGGVALSVAAVLAW